MEVLRLLKPALVLQPLAVFFHRGSVEVPTVIFEIDLLRGLPQSVSIRVDEVRRGIPADFGDTGASLKDVENDETDKELKDFSHKTVFSEVFGYCCSDYIIAYKGMQSQVFDV